MSDMRLRKLVVVLAAIVLLASTAYVGGQEGRRRGEAPVEKKERAKPRGRLPAHFSSVVTEDQREEIYAIQSKYLDQIRSLLRE